jgi:DNA-binding transcriptional MerR regulator
MVLPEPPTYDLNELADRAGVTVRTIRYYIQQGLLPAPDPQGPSTRYGQGHLDRLLLIRHLQREHQPLAEIRAHLEGLRDEDVSRVLSSRPSKRPSSAVDYVREVLGGRAWAPMLTADELPPAYSSAARPSPSARSQWERIALAPDVELHVRRPLTRETNRRVEKLLDLARHILQEEE